MAELVGQGLVHILPDFSGFGKKLKAEMALAKTQMDGSSRGFKAAAATVGASMARIGKGTTMVAAGAAVASLKMAGDFQAHTAVLQTAAGETAKGLKVVRAGIMDIARGTGTGMNELTEGMYTIEKAGYRGAKGLVILKAAAQGAREENADLADVTNAMTSVMASYHLESSDAVRVMNALKTSAGEGKITMEQFSGALSTVIPIASANKISFEEVGGAIATLTQHGTSAREATQELSATIRNLTAPNMVAQREMARFGLSSVDVSTKIGKRGLTGTFELLTDTILKRMGPSGTVLMSAFEGTKQSAAAAQEMLKKIPPEFQDMAREFLGGKMILEDWTKFLKGVPVESRPMLQNFATLVNRSKGFSRELKAGGSASKTYTDALRKMSGGAIGLNTILQLTGESLPGFKERVEKTGHSMHNASKDVEGWGVTQKLFNVRLDMAKQTVAAFAIQIGTKLIPVVTGIVDFFGRHQKITMTLVGALTLLLASTMAVYLGMKIFAVYTALATTATVAWNVATMAQTDSLMIMRAQLAILWISQKAVAVWTGIVTAAQWLWNAAMTANPIGIIIVAIAALVGAIIWIATKTTWFQTAWKYAWNAIKAAGEWAWRYLKPVFEGISLAARIMATIIGVLVVYPIILLFKALAAAGTWLWKTILKPAFDGIGSAIKLVWLVIIKPALNNMMSIFRLVGSVVMLLWRSYVVPAWNGIRQVISLAWAGIKVVLGLFVQYVVGPLVRGFRTAKDGIVAAWTVLRQAISLVWERYLRPVFDKIKSAVHLVKLGFDTGVHGIKVAWDKLYAIARGPISFMVNWVYNRGIVPTWNAVAKITKVGKLNPIKFAQGGRTRGGQPGVDSIPILAMADEFMINRRAAKSVGYGALDYINSTGRLPFAGGGQIPGYKDGGVIGWLGGAAKSVGGLLKDTASLAGDLFMDPLGMWKKLTGPLMKSVNAGLGNGGIADLVRSMPQRMVDGLGGILKNAAGSLAGMFGLGAGSATGGGGAGVKRWTGVVQMALRMLGQPAGYTAMTLRRMNQESGGNPTVVNKWDSNWKAGHPSVGLMQVIGPTFRAYAGKMLKTGPFLYGTSVNPLANVYAAMRYALAAYGSLPRAFNRAGGYANGSNGTSAGWHTVGEHGIELAHFQSGGRVLGSRQTSSLLGGGGMLVQLTIENHGVIGSQHEMENWLTESLDNLRRKGRLQGIVRAATG